MLSNLGGAPPQAPPPPRFQVQAVEQQQRPTRDGQCGAVGGTLLGLFPAGHSSRMRAPLPPLPSPTTHVRPGRCAGTKMLLCTSPRCPEGKLLEPSIPGLQCPRSSSIGPRAPGPGLLHAPQSISLAAQGNGVFLQALALTGLLCSAQRQLRLVFILFCWCLGVRDLNEVWWNCERVIFLFELLLFSQRMS